MSNRDSNFEAEGSTSTTKAVKYNNYLDQQFSTWGTSTPGGTQADQKGYAKKNYMGRISYLGVYQGDTILIWGYAEG
jgi:hypothetical protein